MSYLGLSGTPIRAYWTGASDGDLASLESGPLDPGIAKLLGLDNSARKWRVSRVRQVHGGDVVVDSASVGVATDTVWDAVTGMAVDFRRATDSGETMTPAVSVCPEGDAILSREYGNCLLIVTADCMSIALGSPEGIYGAVHAGWRGLVAGVIENAIDRMYDYGASKVVAAIGPSIGKCCYEFSRNDASQLIDRYGESVMSLSSDGKDTVNLHSAAIQAIEKSGAELLWSSEDCTYCSGKYYSYRRGDGASRQGMFVWRDS